MFAARLQDNYYNYISRIIQELFTQVSIVYIDIKSDMVIHKKSKANFMFADIKQFIGILLSKVW